MPERWHEVLADPSADTAAFEQFVRAHSAGLYRTAFLLAGAGGRALLVTTDGGAHWTRRSF